MSHPPHPSAVAAALAAAKLRAVRTALLSLHKAVFDGERARYERANGRIESAQQALRLAIDDPWFAWTRPLAALIVQIDERLADDRPLGESDVHAYVGSVRRLIQPGDAEGLFQDQYRRTLQEVPDVVMAHGRVMAVLAGGSAAPASSPGS